VSAVEGREKENKIVNNIFTIRFIASLIILVITPIVIQFFPYDPAVKTGIIYFVAALFFQSLISTLTAVFSKKLAIPKVAMVDLFSKVLYFVLLFYLFEAKGSLNMVLGVHSFVYLISFILFYLFLKKYITLRFAWDFSYWKKVFHYTWPLAITVILNLVYFKFDILILSAYHSPTDVGLYGAPYKILEVLTTFPHMFMSLILPLFTAAWISKNLDRLKKIWQHTFDFFSIISIGMMVSIWLISKPLMILLAGEEFAASGDILNVLIVATAMIFFGTLFTYLVVALRLQKQMIKYFLVAAVVGVAGYFIFIPKFSYWGAAYMTLVVEAMIWYFAYLLIKKHLAIKLNYRVFYKSILAGILALLIGWQFKEFNIILTVIVAVIIYSAVLFFTRAIDKTSLKSLFNRKA